IMNFKNRNDMCSQVLSGIEPLISDLNLSTKSNNDNPAYIAYCTPKNSKAPGKVLLSVYDRTSDGKSGEALGAIELGIANTPKRNKQPTLELISGKSHDEIAQWINSLSRFNEITPPDIQQNQNRNFFKVYLKTYENAKKFAEHVHSFILRKDSAFPTPNTEAQRVLKSILNRIGQPKFRASLLRAYQSSCAISGCSAEPALEAAHIQPFSESMSNTPNNGLLLRADIHTLFDLHLISVEPNSRKIKIHPEIATSYGELEGRNLAEPDNSAFNPEPEYLRNHFVRFQEKLNQPVAIPSNPDDI
ncbi:HNH endonuclease, partial [Alcaligenaceae bacterium 429]